MSAGTRISVIGHSALLTWLLLGWGLSNEPLDFQITEVSVVSGEEFEAIVRATTPNPATEATPAPEAPAIDQTPPAPEAVEAPPVTATPEAVETPTAEAPPPSPPDIPAEPAEVVDTAPSLPELSSPADPTLPTSSRPQPRPAPRVASTPAPPPPPDAQVADVPQDAVSPDATEPAEVVTEEQDSAAPEEAAPEIVTEAEQPAAAPTTSVRPRTRPATPPAQTAATEPDEAPAEDAPQSDDAAVDAAVAAALAAATTSAAPATAAGPPLTGAEESAFILAVKACWNVDPGAEWSRVTVVVGFELGRDGRVAGDVRMVNASGGDDASVNAAFQAARRAVLRCGASGFSLPADKYDSWREVELTFDPESMRLR